MYLTPLEDPMTLVMRPADAKEEFAPYRAQAAAGKAACRTTAGTVCPSPEKPLAEGFVSEEQAKKLFSAELEPEISRPGPAPEGKYVPKPDRDLGAAQAADDFQAYLRRSARAAPGPALEDPGAPPKALAPEVPADAEPSPSLVAGLPEALRGWREIVLFALLGLVLIAGIDRLLAMGEAIVYARM